VDDDDDDDYDYDDDDGGGGGGGGDHLPYNTQRVSSSHGCQACSLWGVYWSWRNIWALDIQCNIAMPDDRTSLDEGCV